MTKAKQTYYACLYQGHGSYTFAPIPHAYEVVLVPGIHTIAHRSGVSGCINPWTVTEATSGLAVGNGDTRQGAMQQAQRRLEASTDVAELIAGAIERNGGAPIGKAEYAR